MIAMAIYVYNLAVSSHAQFGNIDLLRLIIRFVLYIYRVAFIL